MKKRSISNDECFILVKAQPHRSSRYFETVCCAGVGRDGKWRRQYPVPYRILAEGQKFSRWDWIEYEYTTSPDDKRLESQKVHPESLKITGNLRRQERARFLNPLVRSSFIEAEERQESLTILRPSDIGIDAIEKSESEIRDERQKHAELAKQLSFFDNSAKPLEPCAMQFVASWKDSEGRRRRHECDDWETSTAFNRFERKFGRKEAIQIIRKKYEEDYFKSGLVLAFSTHSRRNRTHGTADQWLLVGLIRLDHDDQSDLLLM